MAFIVFWDLGSPGYYQVSLKGFSDDYSGYIIRTGRVVFPIIYKGLDRDISAGEGI